MAEDLFAYAYGILASPSYVDRFSEELSEPPPRLPLTKDAGPFRATAALGRRLIFLHTYGERFVPDGEAPGHVPRGRARTSQPIPGAPDGYPEEFAYDEATKTLHVGEGEIAPVEPTYGISAFPGWRSSAPGSPTG